MGDPSASLPPALASALCAILWPSLSTCNMTTSGEEEERTEEREERLKSSYSLYLQFLSNVRIANLTKEMSNLKSQETKLSSSLEKLALDHYGGFVETSAVFARVHHQVTIITTKTDQLLGSLTTLKGALKGYQDVSDRLSEERATLARASAQHNAVLELLEIGQTIEACVKNRQHDDALRLFLFGDQAVRSLQARFAPSGSPIMVHLSRQISEQRRLFEADLLLQLADDLQLPTAVKIVGFLRRLAYTDSSAALRHAFLASRSVFIYKLKRHVERIMETNTGQGLQEAADLLRTHICDVGTHYRALFGTTEGPLSAWLSNQIVWFISTLSSSLVELPDQQGEEENWGKRKCSLFRFSVPGEGRGLDCMEGGIISGYFHRRLVQEEAALKGKTAINTTVASTAASTGGPLTASMLASVYRQAQHASEALRKHRAHFFDLVQPVMLMYMHNQISDMLRAALSALHQELRLYDWTPSLTFSQPSSSTEETAVNTSLKLTRHRPLAVLFNGILNVLNETRQCAMYSLKGPFIELLNECLATAVVLVDTAGKDRVKEDEENEGRKGTASAVLEYRLMRSNVFDIALPVLDSYVQLLFEESRPLLCSAERLRMCADRIMAAASRGL